MLVATGLTKSYGDVHALRGADLDVESGQIVALLGKNGAGKTTMISIIAGLLKADSGTVILDGFDAQADLDRASKLIGIAPQDTGIYGVLTVRENLEFFANLAGVTSNRRSAEATNVAERLGLTDLLERRASKLSGGEARRLHTGCALVHEPKLLMLDEPTVGADVATRAQLIDFVRDTAAAGSAVIYTTHYLNEVEALDADIVIIDDGQILARGTRDELIAVHQMQGVEFQMGEELPESVVSQLGATASGSRRYRIDEDLAVGQLIADLGPLSDDLVSVETVRPDLESVFMAVTGDQLSQPSEEAAS